MVGRATLAIVESRVCINVAAIMPKTMRIRRTPYSVTSFMRDRAHLSENCLHEGASKRAFSCRLKLRGSRDGRVNGLDSPVAGELYFPSMETGYSIGQLAKAAGVPVKTLRYYSNIGLLEPAAITEAKYRRYKDRDVVKVALIRSLRSLGFSLDVIRKVMHNRQTARDVVALQLEVLESQRRSIQRQIAVLRVVNAQSTDADVLDQVHLAHAAASLSSAESDAQIASFISQLAGRHSKEHLGTRLFREIALADIPEELNPAQLEAWIRLSAIMQDPSMQRLQRRGLSSFPATGSGTGSAAGFFSSTTALTRQMGELAAEGA